MARAPGSPRARVPAGARTHEIVRPPCLRGPSAASRKPEGPRTRGLTKAARQEKNVNMGLKRRIEQQQAPVGRMLDAAEALFADQGLDETSVRQITDKAGVNLASVNYHFGSKDDLAEAVFERVMRRVAEERQRNLRLLVAEAEARGGVPDLAEVISCFVEPYLGDGNESQGVLISRFILLHRLSPNPGTRRIVETYLNPLARDYIAALARICPELEGTEVYWRYLLMVSTIVLTATEDRSADRLGVLSDGRASFADRARMRDALIRFLVAGVSGSGQDAVQFVLPATSTARAIAAGATVPETPADDEG